MIDETSFRNAFPEFADTTKYTSAMFDYYAALAEIQLNTQIWGDFLTHGSYLFVAHYFVVRARAIKDSAIGNEPGLKAGVVSSKSVGDVSTSYDTNATNEENGGQWNTTTYGREFLRLVRTVGRAAYVG